MNQTAKLGKRSLNSIIGSFIAVATKSLLLLLLLPLSVSAANLWWDNSDGSTNLWATVENWNTSADGSGSAPAAAPGDGDTAIFNTSTANGNVIASLTGSVPLDGLVYTNTGTTRIETSGAIAYILTLGTGGITINTGAGDVTFEGATGGDRVAFTLAAPQTWKHDSANDFLLGNRNPITTAGHTLTIDGTGDFSFGGTSGTAPPISGTGGVTKNGSGTMMCAANHTFTGVFTLNDGIWNILAGILANVNAVSPIGQGSVVGSAADIVFGGGTLQIVTGNGTGVSTDRLFTIGNANGLTATLDASANNGRPWSFTGTGAIAFGGSGPRTLILTGSNADTNIFNPVLGDAGDAYATSLVKSGAGRWFVTGVNTYSGGTTVEAGTLSIGAGHNLGGATSTLNINGSGKVELTGAVTIKALYIDTVLQPEGTYGVTDSGATNEDDDHVSGTGVLTVITPPSGTVILIM